MKPLELRARIIEQAENSISIKKRMIKGQTFCEDIIQTVSLCTKAFQSGGRTFFCGNGGSAADAQHLAAELSGRFYFDRKPLPSEALHTNTSFLTAVANDYSYEEIYSRLLDSQGRAGDVVFCISTSGNSNNIIRAAKVAKDKQIKVIALTGERVSELSKLADVWFAVPSTDTPRVQECHILIGHIICELIESEMFPNENK